MGQHPVFLISSSSDEDDEDVENWVQKSPLGIGIANVSAKRRLSDFELSEESTRSNLVDWDSERSSKQLIEDDDDEGKQDRLKGFYAHLLERRRLKQQRQRPGDSSRSQGSNDTLREVSDKNLQVSISSNEEEQGDGQISLQQEQQIEEREKTLVISDSDENENDDESFVISKQIKKKVQSSPEYENVVKSPEYRDQRLQISISSPADERNYEENSKEEENEKESENDDNSSVDESDDSFVISKPKAGKNIPVLSSPEYENVVKSPKYRDQRLQISISSPADERNYEENSKEEENEQESENDDNNRVDESDDSFVINKPKAGKNIPVLSSPEFFESYPLNYRDNRGSLIAESEEDDESFLSSIKRSNKKKTRKVIVSSSSSLSESDDDNNDDLPELEPPQKQVTVNDLNPSDDEFEPPKRTQAPKNHNWTQSLSSSDNEEYLPEIEEPKKKPIYGFERPKKPLPKKTPTRKLFNDRTNFGGEIFSPSPDPVNKKTPVPKNHNWTQSSSSSSDNDEYLPEIEEPKKKPIYQTKNFERPEKPLPLPKNTPKCSKQLTFMQSLTLMQKDPSCHPEALKYVTHYSQHKEELALKLFRIFNREIFMDSLDPETKIVWDTRLLKTAGTCTQKRKLVRNSAAAGKVTEESRFSEIKLASKILDSADRLRDTLIHEMCHAAAWVVSGYRDGHGPVWKNWARRCRLRFPELPLITRCHSYVIRTKYTYRCDDCGQEIHRHSKSLNTEKFRCGRCHGAFELWVNKKGAANGMTPGRRTVPTEPKTPNVFAMFVKSNYKHARTPGSTHKEAMNQLSKMFAQSKIQN